MNEEYVLEHIKELCKKEGWTNYELAKRSGLPQSTIVNLFKRTNQPTITTLIKICNAFGITLSGFFAEPGEFPLFTSEHLELITLWESLSVDYKKFARDFLQYLKEKS
ncbi:helix-turn-helix transcriptional regulator (plasmid) [Enterocloster clostridioformis]